MKGRNELVEVLCLVKRAFPWPNDAGGVGGCHLSAVKTGCGLQRSEWDMPALFFLNRLSTGVPSFGEAGMSCLYLDKPMLCPGCCFLVLSLLRGATFILCPVTLCPIVLSHSDHCRQPLVSPPVEVWNQAAVTGSGRRRFTCPAQSSALAPCLRGRLLPPSSLNI